MLRDYLDVDTYNLIKKNFNFNDITEIRLRLNQNIIIAIKNKKYYLKNDLGEYVVADQILIDNFIKRASENSLYAYNENIKDGFLTLPNGIRIGLCGTVVMQDEKVKTIKDFNSINIRIPHFIKNCSNLAYDYIVDENSNIYNTLIISPPGAGKTTFLRDLIYQFFEHNNSKNYLIVDERSELFPDKLSSQYVSVFCDIYTNCSKKFVFSNGIRSMSPDVILTDEINIEKDLSSIENAINCGVNVIATIHAKDIKQLRRKQSFQVLIDEKYFSRYIVLSNVEGPGTLVGIYDDKLNCIYCR